ncbi:hypothetical protein [Aureibacter tunicatorum]|uniref:Uncharacterized protein n=1 Tax=Aureibacter tunicatorum TaxID=866807 RepID=A0AAE4BTT6_9BACT|nr:hypothetical protein [Aureibacter tunicatorum]MDR6239982.1 hypothetical protein [Aureibacter tunicatorum]BDD04454.1 hypothetical protein AUTU_19370 [Aureibacter tunicatorum]
MVDTKKIVPVLTKIGTSAGGAALAYAAIKNAPEKFEKFTGLTLMSVGIMANTSDNKTVQELGLGVAIMGIIDAVDKWMPQSLKDKASNFIPALGNVDNYDYTTFEALPQTNESDLLSFEQGLQQAIENEDNGMGYVETQQPTINLSL